MPVSKYMRAKAKRTGKWFHAGKTLNWDKNDKPVTRRRKALQSRNGNYLKTGRALQSLANVTRDSKTKREAGIDARYFFAKNAKKK
jgi:hypothetical protein